MAGLEGVQRYLEGGGASRFQGRIQAAQTSGLKRKLNLFMNQPGEEGTCGPAQVFTEGPSQQMWATGHPQVGCCTQELWPSKPPHFSSLT